MSDRLDNSREFITEFIELYKSMPCLWYNKSRKYRDKTLKNKAYGILLEKYQEIDSTATKTTVKAKINALRTTYRKVLGKLNQSIQSGATGDEVYKPSLWYFHMFDFLRDVEPPNRTYDSEHKQDVEYDEETQDSDDKYDSSDPFAATSPTPSAQAPDQQYISSSSKRSRKRRAIQEADLPYEEHSYGEKPKLFEREDPFDLYGRHIANKLRSLSAEQNVFAQKLINDVLFEAEMDSLSRGCKILTEVINCEVNYSAQ